MNRRLALFLASAVAAGASLPALADTKNLAFAGAGIDAAVTITYGTATDSKVTQGLEITGISGTFSDATLGISNAAIVGLVAIAPTPPESTNLLAPHDFSRFAVGTGLPPVSHDFLTYDNLYYPGGAPATASDYTAGGGILDIYGILFDIGGGRVVDVWSNGIFGPPGSAPIDYGAAVATADTALDYVAGGVSAVPEPASSGLLLGGLAMLGAAWRRRRTQR